MSKNKKGGSAAGGSRIGSDALILTLSQVITMAMTMVAGMLLARFRTLSEYGTFSQMQLVVNLVKTVILLGLPNSLNYFLVRAEEKEGKRHFLSVYYSLSTVMSGVTGVVLVVAAPLMETYFKNPMISAFAYYLAVQPWTMIITHSVENLMVASGKSKGLMLYRVTHSACYLSLILLIQTLGMTFREFIICNLILDSIFTVITYVIANGIAGGLRFEFDWDLLKKIAKYCIPIGFATIVGTLNVEIDKLMIGGLTDPEQSAIYNVASRELPVSIVASSLSAVLLPQFVRMMKNNKKEKAVELWAHAIILAFAFISLISVGCVTFAPEVMELFYSSKYLPGTNIFRVYCLVLLLRCAYFGIFLNSSGKTRFVLYSSIASLAINALLNYPLYLLFGMIGPAIATFLSVLTMNMSQLIFTSKSIGVPLSKLFPWRACGLLLLLNAGLAGVMLALRAALPLEKVFTGIIAGRENAGAIAEAVVVGIVWLGVELVLLRKVIMKHWRALNAPAD